MRQREKEMKILAACEESQAVTVACRKLGCEAYSCDRKPCSGGHPEWHIQADVIPLLDGNCSFYTADGAWHSVDGKWDMILAFPPCTHLAVSGARYFEEKRRDGRQRQGIEFFLRFVRADCERIAIENPVGIMSTVYRKPDQIIQPYEYGHKERKRTCLWLKGLPPLVPTRMVRPQLHLCGNGRTDSRWHYDTYHLPPEKRAEERSKTFPGIAEAMAQQWAAGEHCADVKTQVRKER